jgi:hypothetical protein
MLNENPVPLIQQSTFNNQHSTINIQQSTILQAHKSCAGRSLGPLEKTRALRDDFQGAGFKLSHYPKAAILAFQPH